MVFHRFCFPYFFGHLLILGTLGTSSWSVLDLFGAPLWGILDHLGLTLGSSWVHFAPLWLFWSHFGSSRVHFGIFLVPSGTLLGRFWDHVGTIFGWILIACEPSTLDPQSWSQNWAGGIPEGITIFSGIMGSSQQTVLTTAHGRSHRYRYYVNAPGFIDGQPNSHEVSRNRGKDRPASKKIGLQAIW